LVRTLRVKPSGNGFETRSYLCLPSGNVSQILAAPSWLYNTTITTARTIIITVTTTTITTATTTTITTTITTITTTLYNTEREREKLTLIIDGMQ